MFLAGGVRALGEARDAGARSAAAQRGELSNVRSVVDRSNLSSPASSCRETVPPGARAQVQLSLLLLKLATARARKERLQ